jgi:hypothetical protein
MKYVNYLFLLGSVILAFVGLYFWLGRHEIDNAAFAFALAAIAEATFVMAIKADRPKP